MTGEENWVARWYLWHSFRYRFVRLIRLLVYTDAALPSGTTETLVVERRILRGVTPTAVGQEHRQRSVVDLDHKD